MPALPIFQVDAFASKLFEGNQACVMPLEAFLPDETLLAIAGENNVSETAYIVPAGAGVWKLRWFSPSLEVPICGHATLASAHVLYTHGGFTGETIAFETVKSGRLTVRRLADARLEMDFPSAPIKPVPVTDDIAAALGARPVEVWGGMVCAARFGSPEDVKALSPDHRALKAMGIAGGKWSRGNFGCFALGGEGADATSRFFAPASGIEEDPATGNWHTMLARILSENFAIPQAHCYQAYPGRGAWIDARIEGDRCKLTGTAVTVIEGQFSLHGESR